MVPPHVGEVAKEISMCQCVYLSGEMRDNGGESGWYHLTLNRLAGETSMCLYVYLSGEMWSNGVESI
jgi:hypothetical protein